MEREEYTIQSQGCRYTANKREDGITIYDSDLRRNIAILPSHLTEANLEGWVQGYSYGLHNGIEKGKNQEREEITEYLLEKLGITGTVRGILNQDKFGN